MPPATLAVCAVAAFSPALWAGFVADDYLLLGVVRDFEGLGWAFWGTGAQEGGIGEFYRPLWVSWNAGLFELFGASAAAFHAANLLLYAAVTVEVWALARRLAGSDAAWLAAFAFALYPRHGESVAWISGSTDLTAAALGLGALLCLLAGWRVSARLVAAAGLAAAAALAKEIAFVLPPLAALVLWTAPRSRNVRWLGPAAMLAAQAGVAVLRLSTFEQIGGYEEYPWRPLRSAGTLVSYLLAAVTPPQLELLRYPVVVVFPVLVFALLAWRVAVLRKRGERARLRLALLGAGWFALTVLPVLNIPVDLNSASGERLLFLPSVGLALGFAALVGRPKLPTLAVAGLVALALCLHSAGNWVDAGRMADRMLRSAVALTPQNGELILLSFPQNYRTAHVTSGGNLDAALEHAGRGDVVSAFCLPVQVREARRGQIAFGRLGDGSYEGLTTWAVPFDFPVLRDPTPLAPQCAYERTSEDEWPPGLELNGLARPSPSRQPAVLAYFDGYDLRVCC